MKIVECESCDERRYVEDDCTIICSCYECGGGMRPLTKKTELVAEVPCSDRVIKFSALGAKLP